MPLAWLFSGFFGAVMHGGATALIKQEVGMEGGEVCVRGGGGRDGGEEQTMNVLRRASLTICQVDPLPLNQFHFLTFLSLPFSLFLPPQHTLHSSLPTPILPPTLHIP